MRKGVDVGLPLAFQVGEGSLVFFGDAEQGFNLVVVSNYRAGEGFNDAGEAVKAFVSRHGAQWALLSDCKARCRQRQSLWPRSIAGPSRG